MNNLSATVKGIITGLAMIAVSLGIYFTQKNFDNSLQYIAYAIYVAGIIWALWGHKQSNSPEKGFKGYFVQGFKCFIVVTFLMVAFTFIFLKFTPSFREEMAVNYRADLVKKGNYTPAEIDKMVTDAKGYFITMLTSMAVFSYLMIGGLVTLIAAAFFMNKKPQ